MLKAGHRQSFAALPEDERLLLWTMRIWVIGLCRQQDVSDRIGEALRELGAAGAAVHLEGFMLALGRGACRPIEVLCLCRTEVSADERVLLDAFALLQADDAEAAQSLLCGFLSEAAAAAAIRSAERIALPWNPTAHVASRGGDRRRVLH